MTPSRAEQVLLSSEEEKVTRVFTELPMQEKFTGVFTELTAKVLALTTDAPTSPGDLVCVTTQGQTLTLHATPYTLHATP